MHKDQCGGWFGGPLVFLALRMRARGPSFKEYIKRESEFFIEGIGRMNIFFRPPLVPLGERIRTLAVAAGLILIGVPVMVVVTTIRTIVLEWQGDPTWPETLTVVVAVTALTYQPIYTGLHILHVVIQDYRLVHYGISATSENTSSRQLTPGQIEPISRALEEHDERAATACYREAAPDPSEAEATRYVLKLQRSLQAENPAKFTPPPPSLATLNWKSLGFWALFLVAMIVLEWIQNPQSFTASAVSQFTYCFLIGTGAMGFLIELGSKANAGPFTKGTVGKLTLLWVPGLLAMIFSETIMPGLVEEPSRSVQPYFWGLICGTQLIIFGCVKPRRGKMASQSHEVG